MGGQIRFMPRWQLNFGIAYDTSPVKDEDRTVDFAVGETYRFGLGLQWQVNPAVNLGLA